MSGAPPVVSVLTLVRGREPQLANLIHGLDNQTTRPAELVIAYMQDHPPALPDTTIPVRLVHAPGDPMPLAAARNRAADAATGDLFIFLDVDCIPGPTLVARYTEAGLSHPGLLLGEVLYLPAGPHQTDPKTLDTIARHHPARPEIRPDEIRPEPDPGALWGLSFALPAETWRRSGGMDERYTGYGAEETDLAATLAARNVPTHWIGNARAYHQHHQVHIPPLQHLDHIIRNAALFHRKWNRWCMEYWLGQFRDLGLIAWGEDLSVRRQPTLVELSKSLAPETVRFS